MAVLELQFPSMKELQLDCQKMRKLREAKDLSQTAAAALANMTLSRWNDIESGRKPNLTIETLSQIAAALGVDGRDILTSKPKRGK